MHIPARSVDLYGAFSAGNAAQQTGSAVDGGLLTLLLGIVSDGIWVVDPLGRTELANDRMAELLAVTPARLARGGLDDLLDPEAARMARERMELRAAGISQEYEMDVTRRDGATRRFHVVAAPRFDGNDRYAGSIAVCSDVTERADLDSLLDGARQPASITLDSTGSSVSDRIMRHLGTTVLPHTRVRSSSDPHVRALSEREFEIVDMLVDGDRVPAIAKKLFLSQSTVRNHLSAVFHKFDVSGQQELITLLRREPSHR